MLFPRPNFFVIGAAKSGTTRLHFLLGLHPEVFTSRFKEPNYFIREKPSEERTRAYFALFAEAGDAKAIGESSVSYSRCQRSPDVARRIYDFNPHAKLIYIVRHPLRRMESGWMEQRAAGNPIPKVFTEAIRQDFNGIVNASLYWKQLSQYRSLFPDSQILLLFSEEFARDEVATLRRCFEFLGVDPNVPVDCSLQEAHNRWQGKKQAHPVLDFLDTRRGVATQSLRALLPRAFKEKIRQSLVVRPITERPQWNEETWNWAVEKLRPDVEAFLAHAGKPLDFWSWTWPGPDA